MGILFPIGCGNSFTIPNEFFLQATTILAQGERAGEYTYRGQKCHFWPVNNVIPNRSTLSFPTGQLCHSRPINTVIPAQAGIHEQTACSILYIS